MRPPAASRRNRSPWPTSSRRSRRADVTSPSDATTTTLLGWSLAVPQTAPGVDVGRDVIWIAGPGGRDLATTSGPANLEQALAVALTTRLDALARETNPILTRERVRIAVIRTIEA